MLALVPSLTRSRTLFVIALTSHHTHVSLTSPPHSLTTLFVIAVSIMLVLSPSLTHSTCACTHHHARSRPLTQPLVLALTMTHDSLTHSLCSCNYTHHDVCLCPLTHTLCLWLHSPRCILTLTVSLTCDCTRHYVCPRPFTTIFTSSPQSLILLHLHSPACSHVLTLSPTHSVCNARMVDLHPLIHSQLCLRLYSPPCLPSPSHWLTHSTLLMIALTIVYACPHPLTYTLYLWLHSPSCLCSPSRMRNGGGRERVVGVGCWGIGSLFVMK